LATARLVPGGDIRQTKVFEDGGIVVQDQASQLVAALVDHGRGAQTSIFDACAAPGSKTLAMADRNPEAHITAVELHPHRARLLQRLLETAHPSARVHVLVADARRLPLSSTFDRVLADVPCSGTGTLSRNPEIKWRLRPSDLEDLQARQRSILRSAMAQVAPGGCLIYSTCSLEKEENEDVIEQELEGNNSFCLRDCGLELSRLKASGELIWPDASSLTRGPYLRTIPGIHPGDGFFAALMEKAGNAVG